MNQLPLAAALVVAVVITSCSPETTPDVPQSQTTSSSQPMTTGPGSASYGVPASVNRTGSNPNGSTWNITVPQLAEGGTGTRDHFNALMNKAADTVIAGATDHPMSIDDGELGDDRSRTVVRQGVVSGALIVLGYVRDAAYPSHNVETVVFDSSGNTVLALRDLLNDPASIDQLVPLAAAADPTGRLTNRTISPDEMQNWIALDEGPRLYVSVPHVMGDYVPVTIPWEQMRNLMTPQAQATFLP